MDERLYIIAGILIAITIYLYIHHWIVSIEEKKRKSKQNNNFVNVELTVEEFEKPRYCPICHAKLGPDDVLYAEKYKGEPNDKIVIKGCTHCYDPLKQKRLK